MSPLHKSQGEEINRIVCQEANCHNQEQRQSLTADTRKMTGRKRLDYTAIVDTHYAGLWFGLMKTESTLV